MIANFENAPVYKTVFASFAHVPSPRKLSLLASQSDKWFAHDTGCGDGVIVRFAALAPSWDEIRESLSEDFTEFGIDLDLLELIRHAYEAGFDAIHFDGAFDILPGAVWYDDDRENKVIPLAYDLPLVSYYDLTDAHPEGIDEPDDPESALYFVLPDDTLCCMSDAMRIDPESYFKSDFTGVISESAFSSLYVRVSDDSESVSVSRVTSI